ncbi:MAG: hypothetical protein JXA38_06730 [Methanosarcinaceae archaeon]|nr:hypothetical protein [Methanosarcinaceae archaeon]
MHYKDTEWNFEFYTSISTYIQSTAWLVLINVVNATDKFCSQCSLVLDHEALDQIQEIKNTLPEIIQLLMKSEVTGTFIFARQDFVGILLTSSI